MKRRLLAQLLALLTLPAPGLAQEQAEDGPPDEQPVQGPPDKPDPLLAAQEQALAAEAEGRTEAAVAAWRKVLALTGAQATPLAVQARVRLARWVEDEAWALLTRAEPMAESLRPPQPALVLEVLDAMVTVAERRQDVPALSRILAKGLALARKQLGPAAGPTLAWLDMAVRLAEHQRKPAEALTLQLQAVEALEGAKDRDEADLARRWHDVGRRRLDGKQVADAIVALQRALAALERYFGKESIGMVPVLETLAEALELRDGALATRTVATRTVRERQWRICREGLEHSRLGECSGVPLRWAQVLHGTGDLAGARAVLEETARRRGLDPDLDASLVDLSFRVLADLRDWPAVAVLLDRALTEARQALQRVEEDWHRDKLTRRVRDLRERRMQFAYLMGDFATARTLAEETLALAQAEASRPGADRDPQLQTNLVYPLQVLAEICIELGDFAAARPLIDRSVALRRHWFKKDRQVHGVGFAKVARLYLAMGDADAARPHLEEALAFARKMGRAKGPEAAFLFADVAQHQALSGDAAAARQSFEQAVDALGEPPPNQQAGLDLQRRLERGLILSQYGRFLLEQGEPAPALARLVQAGDLLEGVTGPGFLAGDTARVLQAQALAGLDRRSEALALVEKVAARTPLDPGRESAAGVMILRTQAVLRLAAGDATGWPLLRRAAEASRRQGRLVLAGPYGVATRLADARQRVIGEDLLLSAALARPGDPDAVDETVRAVLTRKGAVLAAAMPHPAADQDPRLADLQAKVRAVSGQLAQALRTGRSRDLTLLQQKHEALEAELSAASPRFRLEKAAARLEKAALCQALPPRGVLVDYLVFRRSDLRRLAAPPVETLLAVVVAQEGCQVRVHDLGPWAPVAAEVTALRKLLATGPAVRGRGAEALTPAEDRPDATALLGPVREAGARLYRRLVLPWREAAGKAELVVVAPDSTLAFVPFEALVDEAGRWLDDTTPLVYADGGRQLLRERRPVTGLAAGPGAQGALLLGGPDYDLVAAEAPREPTATTAASKALRAGDVCGNLYSRPWQALPGALAEASEVAAALRQAGVAVTLHTGAAAREDVFKAQAPRMRFLSLATHGYALADRCASAHAAALRHPLALSGVVLAGANRPPVGEADDGWLTAAELAALDLQNVDLIALSACETGLGTVAGSEGVFGLRRALTQAGARGVVMSLWQVADEETRRLMTHFWTTVGKCATSGTCTRWQALRQARQALRQDLDKRDGLAHPYHWAAFVYAGEWW